MTRLPLAIDARHPAFDGHFPSQPIVPGVVLLDEARRAIDDHRRDHEALPSRALQRIGSAKFVSMVGPGEPVRLEFESADGTARSDACRIRIYAGRPEAERLAMTGTFTFESSAGYD